MVAVSRAGHHRQDLILALAWSLLAHGSLALFLDHLLQPSFSAVPSHSTIEARLQLLRLDSPQKQRKNASAPRAELGAYRSTTITERSSNHPDVANKQADRQFIVAPELLTETAQIELQNDHAGLFLELDEGLRGVIPLRFTIADMALLQGEFSALSELSPTLKLLVTADGTTVLLDQTDSRTETQVSLPEVILNRIMSSKFRPATINGHAVSSYIKLELRFRRD